MKDITSADIAHLDQVLTEVEATGRPALIEIGETAIRCGEAGCRNGSTHALLFLFLGNRVSIGLCEFHTITFQAAYGELHGDV